MQLQVGSVGPYGVPLHVQQCQGQGGARILGTHPLRIAEGAALLSIHQTDTGVRQGDIQCHPAGTGAVLRPATSWHTSTRVRHSSGVTPEGRTHKLFKVLVTDVVELSLPT